MLNLWDFRCCPEIASLGTKFRERRTRAKPPPPPCCEQRQTSKRQPGSRSFRNGRRLRGEERARRRSEGDVRGQHQHYASGVAVIGNVAGIRLYFEADIDGNRRTRAGDLNCLGRREGRLHAGLDRPARISGALQDRRSIIVAVLEHFKIVV